MQQRWNKRRVEQLLEASAAVRSVKRRKLQKEGKGNPAMGAGRKTYTYDADVRADGLYNFESSQRGLQEDLGGCIFGE